MLFLQDHGCSVLWFIGDYLVFTTFRNGGGVLGLIMANVVAFFF